MAAKPTGTEVPGIDWASMLRGILLVVPLVLVVGQRVIPLFVLGFLFIKPLTMLRTRVLGPPLMNQSLIDERGRGMLIPVALFAGGGLAWVALHEAFPDDPRRTFAIVVLGVLALLVWFRPSMVVLPVLCMTAVGGSGMLLVAAPVVIMLARRDQRLRLDLRRSVRRTAMTMLYAVAGFLLTLPFANASAGAPPAGEVAANPDPASPTDENSWYGQVTRWLFQREGQVDPTTPSRLVQVPGQQSATAPEQATPWLLYLGLALALVILVASVVWFRRRRGDGDDSAVDPNAAMTLARLEAIGAIVGRRRAANEGALTFASVLASRTGDERLATAGPLVSGDVYGSAAVESQVVSSQLAAVEASPPLPPPPPPVIKRIVARIRQLPLSMRGLVVSAGALVGLGALVWFGAPLVGDLREPPARELAYVEQADAPDEWHALMGTSAADLTGWEVCSSTGYEPQSLGWTSSGLSHRTEPLGAELQTRGVQPSPSGGTLRVGTNDMTAWTVVDGSTGRPALSDDEWRVGEWGSVPVRPFASVDAVLTDAAVLDPIRTDYVDRNGDPFARYESLPPDWEAVYDEEAGPSPLVLDRDDHMRVVDIWTDDDGAPTRVRLMADGPSGQWMEWRRLNDVSDARLVLPSCEVEPPWANTDWIGAEPWTPTREVPLQIDFDGDGNPFDAYRWEGAELTSESGGTLQGPIEVLSVGDLTSISAAESDPDTQLDTHTFILEWPSGADMTLYRADEWPIATRINAVGETVAAWDEMEGFYLYESFVTIVASEKFPEITAGELDAILEPLWDNDTHVTTSVDSEPGDELTLLTQSDATSVVAGRNSRGEIVSLLIWSDWLEWRELGFEGTPPPSIAERETQLLECLAGDRDVELSGHCSWTD